MFRFVREHRGQAMVELALVLPIILLLLFGIIEFGRIYHTYLALTGAVREGARLGAVGADTNTIEIKVKETAYGLDSDKISVNVTTAPRGDPLVVEATIPVEIFTPLFSEIIGDTLQVRSVATMRVE